MAFLAFCPGLQPPPNQEVQGISGITLFHQPVAAGLPQDSAEGRSIADILMAYVTGESLNTINERVLPDDDISSRVVDNTMRLFALLVMETHSLTDTTPPDPCRVIEVPGLELHPEK